MYQSKCLLLISAMLVPQVHPNRISLGELADTGVSTPASPEQNQMVLLQTNKPARRNASGDGGDASSDERPTAVPQEIPVVIKEEELPQTVVDSDPCADTTEQVMMNPDCSPSAVVPATTVSHTIASTGSVTEAADMVVDSSEGKGCSPVCTWSCESPTCEEDCKPMCQPPKCETRCNGLSTEGCSVNCAKPTCRIECKKFPCAGNSCPDCATQCSEPQCQMTCPKKMQNCENICEQPVCDWKCKAPKNCPKPKCKMICEEPKKCQSGSFVESMPSLVAGQMAAEIIPAPASKMSLLQVTGGRVEREAAAKHIDVRIRSLAPGETEVQKKVVSVPVI